MRTLTLSGTGIVNTGSLQNFVSAVDGSGNHGTINFTNSATAGSMTAFTNNGQLLAGTVEGGTQFFDTSTAGNASFINNGPPVAGQFGGRIRFLDSSSAGNGVFVNNGGAISGATGGSVQFFGTSSAGKGSFTNNGTVAAGAFGGFEAFRDSSTGANATFTSLGATVSGAERQITVFFNSSTAGSGTFVNNGGGVSGGGGSEIDFLDSSNAGNAIVTNHGSPVSGAGVGATYFFGTATADNSTFTINGSAVGEGFGAFIEFSDTATAGNATITLNGGAGGGLGSSIRMRADSSGATSRVKIFGNANMDLSFHNAPGLTFGSIEGDGVVFLGAFNLAVGGNDLSTIFSGVIQDGGPNGGTGGSLEKVGLGALILTKANTYTGGTTVNEGALLVRNTSGSGTGSGPVQVNTGTLGGTGRIAGAVTVGATPDMGAELSPGLNGLGTLTIQSALTFVDAATYDFELNSSTGKADKVIAKGVSIVSFGSFALFSFVDLGSGTLAPGTVFTVIDNTAATYIERVND